VWYRWQSATDAPIVLDDQDGTSSVFFIVYTGDVLQDLVEVPSASNSSVGYTFTAAPGVTYQIDVVGPGSGSTFDLNLRTLGFPTNDDFEAPRRISGISGSLAGTSYGATAQLGEPRLGSDDPAHSIWYRWKAPTTGTVIFETLDSDFDTTLDVFVGSRLNGLRLVNASDDAWYSQQSWATFGVTAGRVYRIRVDGGFFGQSGDVTVQWRPFQDAPPNDGFAAATVLQGGKGRVSGVFWWATREAGEPHHAGSHLDQTLWYAWTAPTSGRVRMDTIGSSSDSVIAVYTGDSLATLQLVASDDGEVGPSGIFWSSVRFKAQAGTTYHVAVAGWTDGGQVYVNWNVGRPANDDFADAQAVSGKTGVVFGDNVMAASEAGEPSRPSVWYRWTAPATGTATFDTVGSSFDTHIIIQTGFDVWTWVAEDDDSGDLRTSIVSFSAQRNTDYYVIVYGVSLEQQGDIRLSWRMNDSDQQPPTVTMTFPGDGARIQGSTDLEATAYDNAGIDRVEFTVRRFVVSGGYGPIIRLGEDSTAPYSLTWDTTMFPDESETNEKVVFTVRAYDRSSNVAYSQQVTAFVDNWAPETGIDVGSGPWAVVSSRNANFSLWSFDFGSTFECSLDGGAFASCSDHPSYQDLSRSRHEFRARSIDPAGHMDPVPALRSWTVDRAAPCSG
jgi:hypothetical protein